MRAEVGEGPAHQEGLVFFLSAAGVALRTEPGGSVVRYVSGKVIRVAGWRTNCWPEWLQQTNEETLLSSRTG